MSEQENKSPFKPGLVFWVGVICLLGLFVWAAIPNLDGHTVTRFSNACINNLRQIDAAANQFALEHELTNGTPINFPNDLMPYIKLNKDGKIPPCLSGGVYTLKKVGDLPTCSLGGNITPAHVLP